MSSSFGITHSSRDASLNKVVKKPRNTQLRSEKGTSKQSSNRLKKTKHRWPSTKGFRRKYKVRAAFLFFFFLIKSIYTVAQQWFGLWFCIISAQTFSGVLAVNRLDLSSESCSSSDSFPVNIPLKTRGLNKLWRRANIWPLNGSGQPERYQSDLDKKIDLIIIQRRKAKELKTFPGTSFSVVFSVFDESEKIPPYCIYVHSTYIHYIYIWLDSW